MSERTRIEFNSKTVFLLRRIRRFSAGGGLFQGYERGNGADPRKRRKNVHFFDTPHAGTVFLGIAP